MKSSRRKINLPKFLLTSFILLFSLTFLTSCGGNKRKDEAKKCVEECNEVNRRRDGRICLGCFPTSGKSTMGDIGHQKLQIKKTDAASAPLSNSMALYSGLRKQPSITQENGKEIAYSSWLGGGVGNRVSIQTPSEVRGISMIRTVALPQSLIRLLLSKGSNVVQDRSVIESLQPIISPPILGSCGGKAVFDLAVGPSGNLTGSIDLHEYCEAGAVLAGEISFTGQGDSTKVTMSMALNNVSLTSKNDSITVEGTVLLNVTGMASAKILLDLELRDNTNGKVYLLENYRLSLGAEPTLTDPVLTKINVKSGKFYDPGFGYVEVLTTTPFLVYGLDEWPSSGTLVAMGAHSSSITLKVNSPDSYQLILKEGLFRKVSG